MLKVYMHETESRSEAAIIILWHASPCSNVVQVFSFKAVHVYHSTVCQRFIRSAHRLLAENTNLSPFDRHLYTLIVTLSIGQLVELRYRPMVVHRKVTNKANAWPLREGGVLK
jgi:hypothetical protein